MKKINKKELHEIFQNLRKKDQNAYNKLYENYFKLIYGIVFSILKNKDDSEDVTHEIFTKIYRLDANKLPTNNESSWLFTVSKNECYLYLRKSKPNINIEEIYEIPEASNDIDKIIDVEYYNKLIKGLKEDEKLIVSLKVLSNFTFSKISQVMNIPIGTVQWKYYNAINSLKVSVSSLVGAVIAFVIVFARGKMLNSKVYLNEKNENDIDDIVQDDENVNNEESEILEENESLKDNESSEENDNLQDNVEVNDSTIESSKNENINENLNETHNTIQSDNQDSNDKNEQYTDSIQQEISQSTPSLSEVKTNKIDSLQAIFTTIGLAFLIICITFLKIYQQKLRKKSSK